MKVLLLPQTANNNADSSPGLQSLCVLIALTLLPAACAHVIVTGGAWWAAIHSPALHHNRHSMNAHICSSCTAACVRRSACALEEERPVLALASIALGIKTLKIARGLERTGPFVRMLLRVLVDLRFFLAIFVVIVMSFNHAMFLLFSGSGAAQPAGASGDTPSDGEAPGAAGVGNGQDGASSQRLELYNEIFSDYARSMMTAYR